MKLTAIIIIAALTQISAKGFSQNITIHEKSTSVEKVLSLIEKQTSYHFLFDKLDLPKTQDLNVNINNVPVEEALNSFLKSQLLTYKIFQQTIVLRKTEEAQKTTVAIAQKVQGTVTDFKGEPLIGVSVKIKGTQFGTVTDVNGNYTINVPDDKAVLIFSFIGYAAKEEVAGSRTTINVSLADNVNSLSEVVVTGYGETVKKSDLTGAVSTVSAKQIEERHPINLIDALQSQAAGVLVVNNEGAPGATGSIQIRGGSTFSSAGNSPLYVIDGILSQTADNVNPADIESIEVLKDAASAAIYGSEAANGVILITTKRGVAGKPTVATAYSHIFGTMAHKLQQPNSADLRYERALYNGKAASTSSTTNDSLNVVLNSDNDNQALITQLANRDILDFSVSGGSKDLTYYSSLRGINDQGLIVNSYNKAIQARFNLDYQASPKFKYTNRLSFGYSTGNNISEGNTIVQSFQRPSNLAVYYPDGSLTGYISGRRNPLTVALLEINQTDTYVGDIFNQVEYTIFKDLRFTNNFDFGLNVPHNTFFDPKLLSSASPTVNAGHESFALNTNWAYQGFFNYSKSIGKGGTLTAVAGVSAEKTNANSFKIAGTNYANESLYTSNVAGVIDLTNTGTTGTSSSRESFYTRLGYDYQSRYVVSLVFRSDGSSKFGSDNQFGNYYGISGMWRFSEEKFMKWANNFLSSGKLRLSYGEVGNDRIPAYQNELNYTFGSSFYNTVNGVVLSNQFGNSTLKWESNIQKNIGLDLGFFNSKLNVTADYYQKRTNNLLYQRNIPVETGFVSEYVNVGDLNNNGFELTIDGSPIHKKDFSWNAMFNISIERNTILSLYNHQPLLATAGGATYLVQEGGRVGDFYGYKGLGVYQYDASNAYDGNWNQLTPVGVSADGKTAAGGYTENGKAYTGTIHHMYSSSGALLLGGDMIFDNVKKDSVIDANDRQIIGNAQPTFYASLINTFNYKRFILSFTINTVWGGSLYDSNRQTLDNLATSGIVPDVYTIYHSWQHEGDVTDVPYIGRKNSTANFPGTQTRFLENASFIRLSYAKLTYNIPMALATRLRIKNFGVYIYGSNLLTWTNYSWFDPEIASTNALTPGNDSGRYPRRREAGLGLNVNF